MKYYIIILIISLSTISCFDKKINSENLEAFKQKFNFQDDFNNQKNLYEINDSILRLQIQDYFGNLSKEEIKKLLEVEILSLKKDSIYTMPSSNMVNFHDSIQVFRRCGSYDTQDETVSKGYGSRRMFIPRLYNGTFSIPINFFIVDSLIPDWEIKKSQVLEQIDILNKAFSKINITFVLGKLTYYNNDNWHLGFSSNEPRDQVYNDYFEDMIQNLPLNGNELNVIVNGCLLLGQASFPFETNTYRSKYDHIIINRNTFNKKKFPNQDEIMEGETLIHEMGHYFGLFHTFHSTINSSCEKLPYNGCLEGDLVEDTPPQRFCHYTGCIPKDTCTQDSLNDDIQNYMGYNPDNCMQYFTNGQYLRMEQFFYGDRYYLVLNL